MPSVDRSLLTTPAALLRQALAVVALTSLLATAEAQSTKVAFVADQGTGDDARRVLELIRDEGTDLLLIQGDFAYNNAKTDVWIENVDGILGRDFPVLIVVGNHEGDEWPIYKQWQKEKLDRVSDIQCEGDIGVKAFCTYRDFGIVQVSPGIITVKGVKGRDNYAEYITEKLGADNSNWRICSWHKNMRDMQAGSKDDATGWGVYQNCLAQGGLVITGHEHSYSRTHLMSSFESKEVIHTNDYMDIGPNSSIAVVSGLGGHSVRPQLHGGDWFASVYTSDQGATHGALFCNFTGSAGDCYMKDIAGGVPDTFTINSLRARAAEREAAEQARIQAEAEEQARLEAEAAEQARLEAAAAEQARLEALAEEQARLEALAQEQARLDALAEEQARLEALAAEQALLNAQTQNDSESQSPQSQTAPNKSATDAMPNVNIPTSVAGRPSRPNAADGSPTLMSSEESGTPALPNLGGALGGLGLFALAGFWAGRRPTKTTSSLDYLYMAGQRFDIPD